jgi:hypothetical protein
MTPGSNAVGLDSFQRLHDFFLHHHIQNGSGAHQHTNKLISGDFFFSECVRAFVLVYPTCVDVYRPSSGLMPHPGSHVSCVNKDLGNLCNGGDICLKPLERKTLTA